MIAGTLEATELGSETEVFARDIRRRALQMTSRARSSHIGSAFSCADILAVLYGGTLRVRPKEPDWPGRDRFVLSKGHAASALYAALSLRGFFPAEALDEYACDGSNLCGHAAAVVPGVDWSTGSLGHGLPVACGMALAAQLDRRVHRVVALLSDGELDEGSNWEAILFAAHHGLDHLTVIVDCNGLQSLAGTEETLRLEPLAAKWQNFGWEVRECDGHNHEAMRTALRARPGSGVPACILARTVKGKGVSFMEDSVVWHYRSAQGTDLEAAVQELA